MFDVKPPDFSYTHPVWGRIEARNGPAAMIGFALAALVVCGGIRLLWPGATRELAK